MNTEEKQNNAFRIHSHREGRVQPMFDTSPIGPLSPSSSLLVERLDLEPTSWQSHLLEDQLLHFFMKPALIGYSLKDASHTFPTKMGECFRGVPKKMNDLSPNQLTVGLRGGPS